MNIRLGKFNGFPIYLKLYTPFQLFRQYKRKKVHLASIEYKAKFYDQLKVKNNGFINCFQKDPPKNYKYYSSLMSNFKIIVYPYFFILPKLNKLFTLWHEYGHIVALLENEADEKYPFYDVIEAIADFYACCKLKLHFNTYIKIYTENFPSFKIFKKNNYDNENLMFEERYNKLYNTREMPLTERTEIDHVYEFYKDKNALIKWYTLCFKEICGMDYMNYFDWSNFLEEIGWDNDEKRWKYIKYSNCV